MDEKSDLTVASDLFPIKREEKERSIKVNQMKFN
jgi:hypothetical protein